MIEKIRAIVATHAGLDSSQVTPESSLVYDLYVDSLILAEIIYAFENEFNVVFKDSDVAGVKTAGDLMSLVQQKVTADMK